MYQEISSINYLLKLIKDLLLFQAIRIRHKKSVELLLLSVPILRLSHSPTRKTDNARVHAIMIYIQ